MNIVDAVRGLTKRPKAWRLFLAAIFLVPVLLVLPHARSLVIRNAVITAYKADFRAPISGQIESIQLRPGMQAGIGEIAMILHNPRVDSSRLARLEAEAAAARGQVERLREDLAVTRLLAAERHAQMDRYGDAVASEVGKRRESSENEGQALQAELIAARANAERVRDLYGRELVSPAELENAESAYLAAVSRQRENELLSQRLAEQADEIQAGVFQVSEPDGVLAMRQMTQQLDLDIVHLQRQLQLDETAMQAVEAEYEKARASHALATRAEIGLPEGHTVWEVYGSTGTWVSEGSPILSTVNCNELMADIAIDDSTLELIEPGHAVKLRLFGRLEFMTGEVVLVRGSGGLGDLPVLAAEMPHRGQRKGRVLVRINDSSLVSMSEQSCGIGRTTYAEFEGVGLFRIMFHPLFR